MTGEAIWDYDSIAESYGGELSPLTYTFTREFFQAAALHTALHCGISRSEWERSGISETVTGYSNRHLFLNRRAAYRLAALIPGYRVWPERIRAWMFVPAECAEPASAGSRLTDAARGVAAAIGYRLRVLVLRGSTRRFVRRVADDIAAARSDTDDPVALVRHLQQLLLVLDSWGPAILHDVESQRSLMRLHHELARGGCADVESAVAALTADDRARSTHADGVALIARIIRGDDQLVSEVLAADASSLIDVLAASSSPRALAARAGIEQWLTLWGDRALAELKLEAPSFRRASSLPQLVRSAVARGTDRRDEQPDAASATDQPVTWRARRAARRARRFMHEREQLRGCRADVYAAARVLCWSIGDALEARGVLDDVDQLFELELADLYALADAGFTLDDVTSRLDAHHAAQPGVTAVPTATAVRAADRPRELRGQGCSAGVVTGRVRIVTRPEQVLEVDGAIIACVMTDPGWTPVFPSCAAILTERGNLLGHTAIVARELGVPAVIAIRGLLEWVEDGEMLRIDGAAGTVTRLG